MVVFKIDNKGLRIQKVDSRFVIANKILANVSTWGVRVQRDEYSESCAKYSLKSDTEISLFYQQGLVKSFLQNIYHKNYNIKGSFTFVTRFAAYFIVIKDIRRTYASAFVDKQYY